MRRKPLDQELVAAIKRMNIFSVAFTERYFIQQLQAEVLPIPMRGAIVFQTPRDQRILEYMLQMAKELPSDLDENWLTGILLLTLWLAECRAAQLGELLEGEVGLPYLTPNKRHVYKAEFPLCLYPNSCLSCGRLLSGGLSQKFCNPNCRGSWLTLEEQFARIGKIASSEQAVVEEYGTLLNAYTLFIHNPNYKGYQTRNPEAYEQYQKLLQQEVITLFRDEDGNPVDLQGNKLSDAYLVTELEEFLD